MKLRSPLSIAGVFLLFALLVSVTTAPGCASVSRLNHTAESLVRASIAQSEVNRCTVHPSPCLTDDQFKAVNLQLNHIAVDGREFTKLEIAGKATVADASKLLSTVAAETTTLSLVYPDGRVKTVLDKLTELQATLTKLMGKL